MGALFLNMKLLKRAILSTIKYAIMITSVRTVFLGARVARISIGNPRRIAGKF